MDSHEQASRLRAQRALSKSAPPSRFYSFFVTPLPK